VGEKGRHEEAGSLRQYGSLMQLVAADPTTMAPADVHAPMLNELQGNNEEEKSDEQ